MEKVWYNKVIRREKLIQGGIFMKNHRIFSFCAVAVVYLLATLAGVWIYCLTPGALWLKLLTADVASTVLVFVFSLVFENASVYDPYWSVQPMVILGLLAAFEGINLTGALFLLAVFVWGIRLTANWGYTFGDLTHEDWRYIMLREKTKAFYPIINFVGIHAVPTLVVYFCTLPAAYVVVRQPSLTPAAIVFLVLSLLAVLLQGVADVEMHRYRKNRTSPFLRTGVWKYSRHPNYLAEISFWWCIALACLSLAPGANHPFLLGAACNTLLFLCVSIPLADGRQSRKEGFADYKAQTRALLPIPRHFFSRTF